MTKVEFFMYAVELQNSPREVKAIFHRYSPSLPGVQKNFMRELIKVCEFFMTGLVALITVISCYSSGSKRKW
ncbi:hypothetical protein [Iningainema tapete]|uniref:hypothetical protein n=1 Tax=Iningainema tapete TaxID=2806730 RepID=UPI001EE2DD16|nr:hypothetical protein [Iningainema tapete]